MSWLNKKRQTTNWLWNLSLKTLTNAVCSDDSVNKYKYLRSFYSNFCYIFICYFRFNETMQDNLAVIIKIKTRQHAQEMNETLYLVQRCFNVFVPKFFNQILIDVYTNNCGYLKVVNASITDLLEETWKNPETKFQQKWSTVAKIIKKKYVKTTKNFELFTLRLWYPIEDIIQTLLVYNILLVLQGMDI